jgi:hypothetical protein
MSKSRWFDGQLRVMDERGKVRKGKKKKVANMVRKGTNEAH